MLKDITIGQHIKGDSAVHNLNAGVKLVLTFLFAIVLFIDTNLYSLLLAALLCVLCYGAARIPLKVILRSLKPVVPIIIFTVVLNSFLVEGEELFRIFTLSVSVEGVQFAAILGARIILLISGTSLLTYTTSPIMFTAAMEKVLSPLKVFKVPVHELAMMMSIALRFIPTLLEETEKIMNAQKARGAFIEDGNVTQRVKAMIPILVPLFVSAFRRADELAMAMECRCYNGGEGRTRLHSMALVRKDIVIAVIFCLYIALMGFSGTIADYIHTNILTGGLS